MDRTLGLTNTAFQREVTILFVAIFIVPVILPIILIFYALSLLVQKLVAVWAKIFRPDLPQLLGSFDVLPATGYPDKHPDNVIIFQFVCNGQVPLDFLRQQFQQRIINYCDQDGHLKYQKLRQVWTQFCGFLFWKWDENFHLNHHVRQYDLTEPELAITYPCTEQALMNVMAGLLSKPFFRGRSPWEMLLIPDYQYIDDKTGKIRIGSVLTLRIHHALADGLSIFKLVNQLFSIQVDKFPSANFPHLSPLRKLLHFAIMVLKFPYDLAHTLVHSRDGPNSWHIVDKKLSGRYVTFSSDRIPMVTIKAIKNKYGVGYNTAVYAITAGAISRLMRQTGQEVPESMKTMVPFPLPNHPGGLVNHVSSTFFTLSPSVQPAAARLTEIASQIKDPQSLPTRPISIHRFGKVIFKLPIPVIRFLWRCHLSLVMTSFPMHDKPPVVMEGVRIVDIVPGLGNPLGTLGATAICLTAVGHLRIVLNVDQLIFQGYSIPSNFNELVDREINELLCEQV